MTSPVPPVPRRASLVAQTISILREAIQSRRWQQSLPGEHDLCEQLRVSRRTLRAALKQLGAEGLVESHQGKRRLITGRRGSLKRPSSVRVVYLTPLPLRSLNPFDVFLIDHLRERLAEEGYLLEVHASRVPYRARAPQVLKHLEETLRPAGWVLLHSTEPMQRWFGASHLPCVVVGSRYPGVEVPSVDVDYGAVCRHAVGQLLERGHRRLALVNPPLGTAGDAKTEAGVRQAVLNSGRPEVQVYVLQHDGTVANLCARVDSLLRHPQPPTAFLVSRPRHVLTVLGHLLHRGLRVPQEVALISRDDDSFLEDVVPTVARYSSNPGKFASKVSQVVLEAVSGVTRAADYTLIPRFIPGQTLR